MASVEFLHMLFLMDKAVSANRFKLMPSLVEGVKVLCFSMLFQSIT